MWIVFIGPPGAGKGTQCQRLAQDLAIPHLSTGQMLRDAMQARSALGMNVQAAMNAGQLVADSIVIDLLTERLRSDDCTCGALFDGFPRTVAQAMQLDRWLESRDAALDYVLNLRVTDEIVLRRVLARQRADDQPQVFADRLRSYRLVTQPVLDYYERFGRLTAIDGEQSPEQVESAIRGVVMPRVHDTP